MIQYHIESTLLDIVKKGAKRRRDDTQKQTGRGRARKGNLETRSGKSICSLGYHWNIPWRHPVDVAQGGRLFDSGGVLQRRMVPYREWQLIWRYTLWILVGGGPLESLGDDLCIIDERLNRHERRASSTLACWVAMKPRSTAFQRWSTLSLVGTVCRCTLLERNITNCSWKPLHLCYK